MRPVPASTSPRPSQGARSNYKDLPGEPADHALGRSRGGWTTKIHALTDEHCSPITMLLSPGQAGDNPMLVPLLTAHREHDRGPFRLLADKAYSHPSTRAHLRKAKIAHTIPERSDQIAHRKAKGSRGGRPPGFDADTYRHRNTVERGFNRFKHWRGIATRYDKYALTYLGGVLLAAIVIHHRTHLPDTA
jgi:putative transposase